MNLRDRLNAVPGSYEDFVNCIVRWADQDEGFREVIIRHLTDNPDTSSSDTLKVFCEYMGFTEPIEIVEDEFAAVV